MYTADGRYDAASVRNFRQVDHPVHVNAISVHGQSCVACGFKLINDQRPNDNVVVCYLEGAAGEPMGHTKRNVIHYCCGHASGNLHYDNSRFQAVMCLQGRQIWGVSHNNRDTLSDFVPVALRANEPIRWTMIEVIDLILAVKFWSGGNPAALQGNGAMVINWAAVWMLAPILRCTGKNAAHMAAKWYGRGSVRSKVATIFAPGFGF